MDFSEFFLLTLESICSAADSPRNLSLQLTLRSSSYELLASAILQDFLVRFSLLPNEPAELNLVHPSPSSLLCSRVLNLSLLGGREEIFLFSVASWKLPGRRAVPSGRKTMVRKTMVRKTMMRMPMIQLKI